MGAETTVRQTQAYRMATSLTILQRYASEGDDFLSLIVTGGDAWVHHCSPETTMASMAWKHPHIASKEEF
jgi:hypothetical protein